MNIEQLGNLKFRNYHRLYKCISIQRSYCHSGNIWQLIGTQVTHQKTVFTRILKKKKKKLELGIESLQFKKKCTDDILIAYKFTYKTVINFI